ncbi:polyketide synthase [Mycolicibacterium cyprinidarum]|nr:polyketide synthase [Mycolicibacterium sp. NGTWS1803]
MVAQYMADEVRPFLAPVPVPLQLVDHPAEEGIAPRFENVSMRPASELADELDGAADWLGVRVAEILLAALGRAIGRTRGEGTVTVDVTAEHRRLFHTVSLICSDAPPMGPTEMLQGAHTALTGASSFSTATAEVLLNVATGQDLAAGGNHALELRVHRTGKQLHLDWSFDATRFDAYSIEELAEQFPLALIELTSNAAAPL